MKRVAILLIAFWIGCSQSPGLFDQTPDDFEPLVVQAAADVSRTDPKLNILQELDSILRSLGCKQDGSSYLYDGSLASISYADEPYLMVGVIVTGEDRLDVRMYYNRNRPEELKDWITRFQNAVDGTMGLTCDVIEEPSTGPF
ncbi:MULTISPECIES: hypothetical protein [Pirellulaceae]|nr:MULTISPECIES: hypothetical protein [Pirellulaceae]